MEVGVYTVLIKKIILNNVKVRKAYPWLCWCLLILLTACEANKRTRPDFTDTPTSGSITISADISFKPVIDEQIKVFESNNPGTKINVQYKPESDCVKDLWNDSIRMVISTIALTESEKATLADSMNVVVDQLPIARDAIAVIVNPMSPDSLFDMNEIKSILTGTYSRPLIPVFDGIKTTSTIRYILDSVLRGETLNPAAVAASTSDSVINYVAQTPNAVGFIGVSWIGNPEDSKQRSFLKKVKIAYLKGNNSDEKYILPVQANLYDRKYPMTRDLTYILKETHVGLGNGFASFLRGEIGQLIFKRAYLMPGRRFFIFRPVRLNEDSI
ncbi:hypothetical protein PIECOFPK_01397 [Mycovorax composti]|uniref:PBP domain-containing protein n=1 Tax=Mycovorax composti TaxID=2962693 RepID=A0ABZ2EK63_9BACT